jgi:hypothetical protein
LPKPGEMTEVSRPLQVVLILTVAFAGLWFVALRPKGDNVAAPTPAKTQPAPQKSSLPGGLGHAVDKAKATQAQANAAAAAADGKPAPAPAPAKAAATPVKQAAAPTKAVAPAAPVHRASRQVVRGVTPGNVRQALSADHVAVLLFYNPLSSDDRAVRDELASVDRRGGHVAVWSVGLSGLGRFKNVLRGIDVVQSPSVVVLSRKARPRVLEGYTDHAEIDQATLVALLS